MKIRADYVTNSSTTSYVVICKGDFTAQDLRELMGIRKDSPLESVALALYESLHGNMRPLRSAWEIEKKYQGNWETYVREEFSETLLAKIESAEANGKTVFVGTLASDGGDVESLFCCDSFEWENKTLYIHATECVW